MRDFLTDIAIPTTAYFLGVAISIGFVLLAFAVVTDIVSDPLEISWQEDSQ